MQVNLDGPNTDREPRSNFLIVETARDQADDLELSWRQDGSELAFHGLPLCQPGREVDAVNLEPMLPCVNGSNAVLENTWGHAFEHDASCAKPGSVEQIVFILAGREDDDSGRGGWIEAAEHAQPVLTGELQVQDENVGMERLDCMETLCRSAAGGEHFKRRLRAQKLFESLENKRVIVYQNNSNGHHVNRLSSVGCGVLNRQSYQELSPSLQ
jgi:hypothetical protein